MNQKEISVFFVSAVLIMVLIATGFVSLNLMGCGADEAETGEGIKKLTGEEQKDLARFVEYVFFPTSPYVDKSWVEIVPEEEVAEKLIDFPTETAAIQQIYTQVYSAWNANDFEAVASYFYPSTIRFVFLCPGRGLTATRLLSKYSLRNPRTVCNIEDFSAYPLSSTPVLTEFYIRRKNIRVPWREASAKTADNTYIYLTKRGDTWFMNELIVSGRAGGKSDTRKYFDDPKYKAPEQP